MGGSASVFSEEELEDYQELTYFTKKEIVHVFKRFRELEPERLDKDKRAKITIDKVLNLEELRVSVMRFWCQLFFCLRKSARWCFAQ